MSESDLYETIVEIPHYQQKYMQLLDKEDEEGVVEDNLEKFQAMYHPISQSRFGDIMSLTGNKFECDQSVEARKVLARAVNDNVYKNIDKFSVLLFDDTNKRHKAAFTEEEKELVVSKLVEEPMAIKEHLDSGVDRILLLHRNTKIFLFMMTGPFLIILQTVKYILKYGTIYYFYLKGLELKKAQDEKKD